MIYDSSLIVTICGADTLRMLRITKLLRELASKVQITIVDTLSSALHTQPHILITDTVPQCEYCDLTIAYTEAPPTIDILHHAEYPMIWVQEDDRATLTEVLKQVMDTSNGQIKKYKECCRRRCQCS